MAWISVTMMRHPVSGSHRMPLPDPRSVDNGDFPIKSQFLFAPDVLGGKGLVHFHHSQLSDHPHGRGEKCPNNPASSIISGSSPRAWGKALFKLNSHDLSRIIPTGVGKRTPRLKLSIVHLDHPHGRGEKQWHLLAVWEVVGSSPRAWGKVFPRWITMSSIRIIPTGVGKRNPLPVSGDVESDHPHGRGEKVFTL